MLLKTLNKIWFSIGDFSGILGPAAWERRGTSPLTLLPQYTSLLWVSSMELRQHIVDLKGQQEDSIGGAHRSRLRKAVAAPILTRPPSVPIGFVPQKSHSQAGLASKSETVRMPHWLGVRSNSQRVRCDLLCAPLKNPQPQLKLTRDVFLDKKTFWRSNCFINWKPKKW